MRKLLFKLVLVAATAGVVPSALATTISQLYSVDVNTNLLAPGSYFLDFQLNDGDGIFSNTNVVIDNITSAGITFVGTPTTLGGHVTFTFGGFSITDGNPSPDPVNDVQQAVTISGAFDVRFHVALNSTLASPPLTPDAFTFTILDSGMNSVVSTGNMNLFEADATLPMTTVFTTPADAGFSATFGALPEPGSWALVAVGLIAMALHVARVSVPKS